MAELDGVQVPVAEAELLYAAEEGWRQSPEACSGRDP